MELSGNLKDIEFPQIISLIAHIEGILELWNLPRKRSAKLYIKRRKLRCVELNGRFLDGLRARSFFAELGTADYGAFEFYARRFRTPCSRPLNWPLNKIALAVMTHADERERRKDSLPDPGKRFRLAAGADVESSPFLRAAAEILEQERGASARELARSLDLPLEHVRYYLHRLAERGHVEPAE